MNLTEIRNILNDEDIMLTKSLGQTFMHDQNQLCKIVGLAKLTPDDQVIEIGRTWSADWVDAAKCWPRYRHRD